MSPVIQKIMIIGLLIVTVGILVVMFVDSSGREVARRRQFFTNPFAILGEDTSPTTTDATPFPFPAVPAIPIDEIESGEGLNESYDATNEFGAASELLDIEREYDTLAQKIAEAQQFGNPSPHRGLVRINDTYAGATADDPKLEYLILEADAQNTAPVTITGWSLQSVYTNKRLTIPEGVREYVSGSVPDTAFISLNPGERAVLATGISPVGISFKENMCTAYLGQFQTFVPSLEERCPTAESEVLMNPATTRTADPACVAFAQSIPRCRFYMGETPNVSSLCYAYIRNNATYNGCVSNHRWRPSFMGDAWRVFLGQARELWQQDHDVIRLLDQEGRVVDIWAY